MLKQYHLEAFELHAQWLNSDGEEGRQAILENADLQLADLSGRDLRFAVLSGANLQRATLNGANLENADLRRANLSYASLKAVTLRGANMSRARADGADFHGADMAAICVEFANFDHANLRKVDLSNCEGSSASMNGCDLGRANLAGACFDKARFRQANLTNAVLTGTSLCKANMVGAKAAGVRFEDADTTSAIYDVGLISTKMEAVSEGRKVRRVFKLASLGAFSLAGLVALVPFMAGGADLLRLFGVGGGSAPGFSYLIWIGAAVAAALLGMGLLLMRLKLDQAAQQARLALKNPYLVQESGAAPAHAAVAVPAARPTILTSEG
jgi:uncharacterized protein YjbI with pentapeptide repeats